MKGHKTAIKKTKNVRFKDNLILSATHCIIRIQNLTEVVYKNHSFRNINSLQWNDEIRTLQNL